METDCATTTPAGATATAPIKAVGPREIQPPNDPGPHRLIGPRDLALTAVLALAAAWITGDAWSDILRLGLADEELSYVLLAPVVIGWLAWVRRHDLMKCSGRRGWIGLPILLFGWLVYWYGFHADPVLWRAGAVVVVVGTIVTVAGGDLLFKLAPAFVAGSFLIPILP